MAAAEKSATADSVSVIWSPPTELNGRPVVEYVLEAADPVGKCSGGSVVSGSGVSGSGKKKGKPTAVISGGGGGAGGGGSGGRSWKMLLAL
jgi:hypothetical protein